MIAVLNRPTPQQRDIDIHDVESGVLLHTIPNADGATWGPPGDTRVVYVPASGDQLRVVNVLDPGSDVQLLEAGGNDIFTDPLWSPDGATIALNWVQELTEPVFMQQHGLALVDADGSNLRSVALGPYELGDWSPDSAFVLAAAMTPDFVPDGFTVFDAAAEEVAWSNTDTESMITPDRVAWGGSPATFYVARGESSLTIESYSTQSQAVTPLRDVDMASGDLLVASPPGAGAPALAWIQGGVEPGLWIMNADGTDAALVVSEGDSPRPAGGLDWSANGEKVAFVGQEADKTNIYLASRAGVIEQVTNRDDATLGHELSWQP